jgi:hypothetical protein
MSQSSPLKVIFLVAAAVGLTIGGGYVQGKLSHRWGQPPEITEAVKRLSSLPETIGHWKKVDDSDLSDYERSVLQCHAHLRRVYRHAKSGQTVQVSLLLGPAGPTSVHTPEMCLGGGPFTVDALRTPLVVTGRDDQFWTVTFKGTDVSAQSLRAVYAWRFEGSWEAPREPRVSHGTLPYLYKLQVVCQGDATTTLATCEDFFRDFLPMAEACTTVDH